MPIPMIAGLYPYTRGCTSRRPRKSGSGVYNAVGAAHAESCGRLPVVLNRRTGSRSVIVAWSQELQVRSSTAPSVCTR
jgi:hypothetical protein